MDIHTGSSSDSAFFVSWTDIWLWKILMIMLFFLSKTASRPLVTHRHLSLWQRLKMEEAVIVKIEKFLIKSQASGFSGGHLQSCKLNLHFFREAMVQDRGSADFRGISGFLPFAVASAHTPFPENLGRQLVWDLWFPWKSQHTFEIFVPS